MDHQNPLWVIAQAFREVAGAQSRGPGWYTRGERGLYEQVAMWVRKGSVAVRALEWEPIETAPKDGTHILLYEGFEPIITEGVWADDEWVCAKCGPSEFWKEPTHWMPLPKAPE